MTSVFLVGVLLTDREPPQLVEAGIYSEDARSLTQCVGGTMWVDLYIEGRGTDFESARVDALEQVRRYPWMRWVVPLLRDSEREVFEGLVTP